MKCIVVAVWIIFNCVKARRMNLYRRDVKEKCMLSQLKIDILCAEMYGHIGEYCVCVKKCNCVERFFKKRSYLR